MIGYKLGQYGTVTEFSYTHKTSKMYMGVKFSRNIVGTCYSLATRLDTFNVYDTALEPLEKLRKQVTEAIHQRQTELGQINKAIRENR